MAAASYALATILCAIASASSYEEGTAVINEESLETGVLDDTAVPTFAPTLVAALIDGAQQTTKPNLRSQHDISDQAIGQGNIFDKLAWKLIALAALSLCVVLAAALCMTLRTNRDLKARLKVKSRLEPSAITLADQAKKGNARRQPRPSAYQRDPVKADALGNALFGLRLQKEQSGQHTTTASTPMTSEFLITPSVIPGPSLTTVTVDLQNGPQTVQLTPHSPLSAVEIANEIFDQICTTEDAVQVDVAPVDSGEVNSDESDGVISFEDAATELEGKLAQAPHNEVSKTNSSDTNVVGDFIEALEAPPAHSHQVDNASSVDASQALPTERISREAEIAKETEVAFAIVHNDQGARVMGPLTAAAQPEPEVEGHLPLSTPEVQTRTQYYHQRLQRALQSHDASNANGSTPKPIGMLSPQV
jgi:hypothetical protein